MRWKKTAQERGKKVNAMEEGRPDPELLLKKVKMEEAERERKRRPGGKLKIFLGYAAGAGKTYAMLSAAQELKKNKIDVVAGYIEPHARPDTQALTVGLEMIPPMIVEYKGVELREFNLDAALKRKPQLILVDEFAHTNAPGCRNEKRYQDVKELLRAGISVYTTLNIQHLESLNDLVGSITKIEVKERIPDSVFDAADQVELVDIEPDELIERMREGKIYKPEQAERAMQNFFTREKLVALREIALRRCADRVNHLAEMERMAAGSMDYHTGEHVLVCISPSPSCAKVIRTAARLAYAFRAKLTALYVETPEIQASGDKTKAVLKRNIDLAKALGASIVSVFGTDVPYQIAEYASVSNVSKIVMGRTNHRTKMIGKKRTEIFDRLTTMAPNVDIYIIPDMKYTKFYRTKPVRRGRDTNPVRVLIDLTEITALLLAATLIGFLMRGLAFEEANIIMVYILGVLFSSYIATQSIYALYSSVASVLLFNFFFTEPYYSLKAYDSGYTVTFMMMFILAFFTSALTRKLKQQSREIARAAYRTEILLENSQRLRRCKSKKEVWENLAEQVGKLLNLSLIIYPVNDDDILEEPLLFPRRGYEAERLKEECIEPRETAVAQWVAANHHRAGVTTHTLPDAKALYLPIQDAEDVRGVMGIVLEERRPIQNFEYSLLIAMLNETGVKLQDTFLT